MFKWLNKTEIDKFHVKSISENGSDVYTWDFDFEHTDDLHELHNDYTLAPEMLEINHSMLSNYCCSIAGKHEIKIGGNN